VIISAGCPYPDISEGPIYERLDNRKKRFHLLDYLLTELQAVRMIAINKPDQNPEATDITISVNIHHTKHVILNFQILDI
jgi:hypothetical protein